MTFNTGNPIGSTDARDRLDNTENMDILENSVTLNEHPDRLGVMRKTRKGMELEHDNQMQSFESDFDSRLAGMAFTRVGTFTSGATLTDMRQTLLWELSQGGDGREYGWVGSFLPAGKVVAAGSSPTPISIGNWVDRTEDRLRSDINVVQKTFSNIAEMKVALTIADVGKNVEWIGYYSAHDGGGNRGVVTASGVVDNGSVFSANASGVYVQADFTFIEPAKFGFGSSRTAAENTAALTNAIIYAMNTKKKIQHYVGGSFNINPISVNGSSYDNLVWECPRGLITLVCSDSANPAVQFIGSSSDTFQYPTFKGFRVSSPYTCVDTANTEHLVLDGLILIGGGKGITQSLDANETDIKPIIRDIIFSGCSNAYKSGNTRVADAIFENWKALNCGLTDGDWVYDFGYIDGAELTKLQIYTDSSFAPRNNGLRMIRPIYVNFHSCDIFEVNGIGVQLSSPRNTVMDETNNIIGCGKAQNDPALSLALYAGVTDFYGTKLRPRIRNNYGKAVQVTSVNDIDFSWLEETGNCLGNSGLSGMTFTSSTGCKLHDTRHNSVGAYWLALDAATVEVRNPDISSYTSDVSRVNSGAIKLLSSGKTRSLSTPMTLTLVDEDILYDASSGGASITLAAANGAVGRLVRITKIDSSANGIGICGSGGQLINGAASYSLAGTQFKTVTLKALASSWAIVSVSP